MCFISVCRCSIYSFLPAWAKARCMILTSVSKGKTFIPRFTCCLWLNSVLSHSIKKKMMRRRLKPQRAVSIKTFVIQTNQGEADTFISSPQFRAHLSADFKLHYCYGIARWHLATTLNIHNAQSALWMISGPVVPNVQTSIVTVLWICERKFSKWIAW